MTIKRYDLEETASPFSYGMSYRDMRPNELGDWVMWEDIEDTLNFIRAVVECDTKDIKNLQDSYTHALEQWQKATPATYVLRVISDTALENFLSNGGLWYEANSGHHKAAEECCRRELARRQGERKTNGLEP